MHHFDANFEKLVQKIVISGDCLQFPEIPEKISEIFTEKSAISMNFQQHFEKICKMKNRQKIIEKSKMCENPKFLKRKRCKSLFIL